MHTVAITAPNTALRGFSFNALLSRVLELAEVARQRRALAALDARALEDLGISRAAAEAEAAKPFWA